MSEKFSSEYRSFASAAKEAGFDKDERKLSGLEPSLVLEGASDSLKTKITPEVIGSFFRTLEGEEKVPSRDILEIGNYLYTFRGHAEDAARLESLSEKDVQLINLGCTLLENAFYKGKLLTLEGAEAAPLAFSVNVLAKIFERPQATTILKGFSAEKFDSFISKVHDYEQKTLFPDAKVDDPRPFIEQEMEKNKREITELLDNVKRIEKETNWDDYFRNETKEIKKAIETLKKANKIPDFDGYQFSGVFEDSLDVFKRNQRLVFNSYKLGVLELAKMLNRQGPVDSDKIGFLTKSVADRSYMEALKNVQPGDERSRSLEKLSSDERRYADLVKKNPMNAPAPFPEKTKKKTLTSFDDISVMMHSELVPEAIKHLDFLFAASFSGPLGDYLKNATEALRLLRRRNVLTDYDQTFSLSERRLRNNKTSPQSVPYFIKTCLIIQDKLGSKGAQGWDYQMATGKNPFNYLERKQTNPAHSFIVGEMNHQTGMRDSGPAYANLHFIPEDIPFAVWTRKYLLSQQALDSKRESAKL